jgi:hypothetical protein
MNNIHEKRFSSIEVSPKSNHGAQMLEKHGPSADYGQIAISKGGYNYKSRDNLI